MIARSAVLKLQPVSDSPRGLVKTQIAGPGVRRASGAPKHEHI